MKSNPRIVVVGSGGVGGFYGARLAAAGADVTFVARGAQLEAIRARGLRIVSQTHGDWTVCAPAVAPEEIGSLPPADLVLIATKAFDTATAIATCRPVVASSTIVMSLQNGVEAEEILRGALLPQQILGAMTVLLGARVVEPGVIEHVGESRLVFGEYPSGESERVAALADFLRAHGVNAIPSTEIRAELWRKLMINNAANALSALTGFDTGRLTRNEDMAALCRGMMREVHAVAVRAGVALDPADPDRTFELLRDFHPIKTSMLQDVEAGRPFELEAIVGVVVREASRLGVAVPVNDVVYRLLRARFRELVGS